MLPWEECNLTVDSYMYGLLFQPESTDDGKIDLDAIIARNNKPAAFLPPQALGGGAAGAREERELPCKTC